MKLYKLSIFLLHTPTHLLENVMLFRKPPAGDIVEKREAQMTN